MKDNHSIFNFQVESKTTTITLDPKKGENGMIVKNTYGDWGIVKGCRTHSVEGKQVLSISPKKILKHLISKIFSVGLMLSLNIFCATTLTHSYITKVMVVYLITRLLVVVFPIRYTFDQIK